jgi:kynurenine formamidase
MAAPPELIDRAARAAVVELGHPLEAGMPNHVSHPPFILSPYLRHGDFELPGGYTGANELIVMSGHAGTHLDAFAHVGCNGRLLGGQNVAEAYRDGRLSDHTIDTVAPFVCRGVMLDIARQRRVAALTPPEGIDAEELAATAEREGVAIEPGDCVLVRTGHGSRWGDPQCYLGEESGLPGITLEAAAWLAESGVALVGSDTPIVERCDPGGVSLPVHLLLLAEHGVHLLENLELEALHAAGAVEFLFVCVPLRLAGSTGSPVRPLALLEGDPAS